MPNRRQFLRSSALMGAGAIASNVLNPPALAENTAPGIITSEKMRPQIPYGVASGDVTGAGDAVIWSRCVREASPQENRPGRMIVEYARDESFRNARRVVGPAALESTDFTARVYLYGLPKDRDIFYRVSFQDLADTNVFSQPVTGRFRTAPGPGKDVCFAWSGDTAGQGWGINSDWGGMKMYETIRKLNPDFFIHCGDSIYADEPIQPEVRLDDGSIWRNLTTPETSKVAETIREFRGNYIYNLLDENVRRFNAEVPQVVQWDDHETLNNWYPTQMLLDDDRYKVKSVSLLAARAKQAFLEYTPINLKGSDRERIYRSFNYGPYLDVFMLDTRSYRGPNTAKRQIRASEETAFLGDRQLRWLKQKLRNSKATWKVISNDMPIGVTIPDGDTAFDNMTNGDGPPWGRELEMAELLRSLKQENVQNVVWLTADIHCAAAHYYNPNKAQFQDFNPFWEFVSGPIHASNFTPQKLDNTFGPELKFRLPSGSDIYNLPPTEGQQFCGTVKIDGRTQVMTVKQYNLAGEEIYSLDLPPEI